MYLCAVCTNLFLSYFLKVGEVLSRVSCLRYLLSLS